jgi:hypothetical protein
MLLYMWKITSWSIYLEFKVTLNIRLCIFKVFPTGGGKAVPVTGREGPQGCERSSFPHFLDNRLTDGGEVVSLTCRPSYTPQKDSWCSFLSEAVSTTGS